MKHKILAAIAAAMITPILFAQSPEPPSEETLKKASYAMGTSVAQQVAADQQNMVQDRFMAGFKDVVEGKADVRETMSYAEGVRMALRLQNDRMGMDANQVLQGMQDATAGGEMAYSQEELQAAMQELQEFARAQQQAQMQQQQAMQAQQSQAAEENKAKGEAFLAGNAKEEGVMTTLSGLQYKVIEEGEGDKPAETDTVKVHYTGRLLNGDVFDSSVERGEPVEFPLNRVIPGWTEGLQLMSPGATYRFWIPSDLAYGPNAPPAIGPNQVLSAIL